jgi:hypothetical protein
MAAPERQSGRDGCNQANLSWEESMKKTVQAKLAAAGITDDEIQKLQATESAYAEQLMPHLLTLTPDARVHLPKIGASNIDFTRVAIDYGRAHPELVPPYTDIEAAASNLALFETLRTLQQQRAVVDRAIEDTMMQCGSAAYAAGLGVYDMAKSGGKRGLLGAVRIAQDLGARLPTRGSRSRAAPKPVDGAVTNGSAAV